MDKELINQGNLVTYSELAQAYLDLLDGWADWREVQQQTGLTDERCKDLVKIFNQLETK